MRHPRYAELSAQLFFSKKTEAVHFGSYLVGWLWDPVRIHQSTTNSNGKDRRRPRIEKGRNTFSSHPLFPAGTDLTHYTMTGRKRKRASMLIICGAFLALNQNCGVEVMAFGVPNSGMAGLTIPAGADSATSLHVQIKGYRDEGLERRNTSTARQAALVDSESSRSRGRIRSRVQSFLRSKKNFQSNQVVQEVTDIDAIKCLLGEAQSAAAYTAVIFHAPYCKACKASMPLFENLAKQYSKKAKQTQQKLRIQQRRPESWQTSNVNQAIPMNGSSSSQQLILPTSQQPPSVRFVSVPVTQDNASQLQDRFGVTKFPLAHIYDPIEGLVDERPVLRKLFSGFEERLASVVEEK